jgi:hypothetical protein
MMEPATVTETSDDYFISDKPITRRNFIAVSAKHNISLYVVLAVKCSLRA